MICHPCRDAAAGIPDAEHCDDPGGPSARCCCQHRTPPAPSTEDTQETP